jgi:hypothetical protein
MGRNLLSLVALLALGASQATAQTPVIDGSLDAAYGAALSVQNTNTQFGNAMNGDFINEGGGSELNAVYARVAGGRLYVFVAGNLETGGEGKNFNKLEFFFDTKSGGVNTIVGAEQPGGVDGFCCGGFPPPNGGNTTNFGALQRMNGLTFDADFNADYYVTLTHGFEGNIDGTGRRLYAATAHYATLDPDGAGPLTGSGQALGMQLAHRGLPNVLRGTTSDVDIDGDADGNDFLVWQRNVGATGVNRKSGDITGNGNVDGEDLASWTGAYGFEHTTAPFDNNFFAPLSNGIDNSNVLLGQPLPDLVQGQLIDKAYVTAHPAVNAPELQFVLPVITENNPENRRDMLNTVDLRLAVDNSNIAGVSGDAPYTTPTTGNPGEVTTGFEFSIPLAQIGSPTGDIKLFAFINGGGHDYASNQFSGDGILDGNLGGNGFGGFTGDLAGVNLADFAGNQFVTVTQGPAVPSTGVVPEPAAGALLAIAALAMGYARRR